MSKPIKEIGRTMFSTNFRDGFFSTLERAERAREATEAPELGTVTPIILLSLEDRRELVREVIWHFVQPVNGKYQLNLGDSITEKVDMFIKDMGL